MNQTERNLFKQSFTNYVKQAVISKLEVDPSGLTGSKLEVVEVAKGFIVTDGIMNIEISATIKKSDFDIEDAILELEEKKEKALKVIADKAKKVARAKAKKEKDAKAKAKPKAKEKA